MIRVGSMGAVVLRPGPGGSSLVVAVILPGCWMSAGLVAGIFSWIAYTGTSWICSPCEIT